MIVTFKTLAGKELVQVRSMSDGLNYQLYIRPSGEIKDGKLVNKKNGKEVKRDWIPQQCYAQELNHAIALAVEKFLKLSDSQIEIEIKETASDIEKAVQRAIARLVKDIVMEVQK